MPLQPTTAGLIVRTDCLTQAVPIYRNVTSDIFIAYKLVVTKSAREHI